MADNSRKIPTTAKKKAVAIIALEFRTCPGHATDQVCVAAQWLDVKCRGIVFIDAHVQLYSWLGDGGGVLADYTEGFPTIGEAFAILFPGRVLCVFVPSPQSLPLLTVVRSRGVITSS